MSPVATPISPNVRVLSHNEIIDHLYGPYLGKKRTPPPPAPEPPAPVQKAQPAPAAPKAPVKAAAPAKPVTSADSAWTGSEILTGELQRLRSELISLRKEKEQLAVRLERAHRPARQEPAGPAPAIAEPVFLSAPAPSSGGWIGKIFVFMLLLGVFGYLSGTALQASPSAGGDFTPYTVQVAVYNGPSMANQAQVLLRNMGYQAFVAPMPRVDGKVRYRVYVGSFVTKEEAAQESQRLESDTRFRDFKDAFVLIR